MLFSNIFNFNLSFEDSSMKIETLRMFANKLRRDVKVLEERKEIERLLARGRKREREKRGAAWKMRGVKVLLTRWKNHYRFWGNKLLIYTATLSLSSPPIRVQDVKGDLLFARGCSNYPIILSLVILFLNEKRMTMREMYEGERLRRVKFNDIR